MNSERRGIDCPPKARVVKSRAVAFMLVAGVLGGCSSAGWDSYNLATKAIPPRASSASPQIVSALACIRDSGALRNTRVAVAIHADGTGKYNHIADGATGNYLPQGTTAVYASEAVLLAGGRAYNYYELNTERAMRAFTGGASYSDQQRLQEATRDVVALSVADVLSQFRRVPPVCRAEVESLLNGQPWPEPEQVAAAPEAVVQTKY